VVRVDGTFAVAAHMNESSSSGSVPTPPAADGAGDPARAASRAAEDPEAGQGVSAQATPADTGPVPPERAVVEAGPSKAESGPSDDTTPEELTPGRGAHPRAEAEHMPTQDGAERGPQYVSEPSPGGGEAISPPAGTGRRLPGPASSRRVVDRDALIARRQLVVLCIALLLSVPLAVVGYRQVAYRAPVPDRNAEAAPQYTIQLRVPIDSVNFKVNGTSTSITCTMRGWRTAGAELAISSDSPDRPLRLLQLDGQNDAGTPVTWQTVDSSSSSIQLRAQGAGDLTTLTVALENGTDVEANQYRYLRTGRVDVVSGVDQLPSEATGTLDVETGAYTIDRLATAAISQPGASQGTIARYNLKVENTTGIWTDSVPVPGVSVDLVNVERQRAADARLLLIGAVLGVLGGLVIETILTAAHVMSSPRQLIPTRS
jgi:hypothetical protein